MSITEPVWSNDRAWAMRTSRDSEADRKYIREQLDAGWLRQGWGSYDKQDLRLVTAKHARGEELDGDERGTWGHRRFLGEPMYAGDHVMQTGDLVLVPNMPEDGLFTLTRLEGSYEYEGAGVDFRHKRRVVVLTQGGVANTSEVVHPDIRTTLRCRSRLWWIGGDWGRDKLIAILDGYSREGASVRTGSDHVQRAIKKTKSTLTKAIDETAHKVAADLRNVLRHEEYEPLLQAALLPLMSQVEIEHTGGPSEKGADLVIRIPNPFLPSRPWLIALQVKDYDGEIHEDAADQLEQVISNLSPASQGEEGSGGLVAVILVSTRAAPSTGLVMRMKQLAERHGVAVRCAYGDDVMRAVTLGLIARGVAAPEPV